MGSESRSRPCRGKTSNAILLCTVTLSQHHHQGRHHTSRRGPAAASQSAAMASADTSPRGHLIVKSHAPLPRFACAVPVPHPDAKIDQLRTTIVAILTGQVSAKATSSTVSGNGVGSSGGVKASDAPLSYSEHVKQVTIHEWRMKSLVLELRQNSLIAPETRGVVEEEQESVDEGIRGFELQDDHECSLLEHGDEVK